MSTASPPAVSWFNQEVADAIRIIDVLAAERVRLGLSARTVSRMIGVLPQQIGRYERGENTPKLTVVVRWARALDVSVVATPRAGGADMTGNPTAVRFRLAGCDG